MAQISLLDSTRMSKLLEDALSWSPAASSLLVSANNGSILAYAFRDEAPSIKDMRTLSTTMTAAYTAASENTLVYESQSSGTISVIGPVADHILLAVTGRAPSSTEGANHRENSSGRAGETEVEDEAPDEEEEQEEGNDRDVQKAIRNDLEMVSDELATILRDELRDMRWPDDI